jgi:hypothetical protein
MLKKLKFILPLFHRFWHYQVLVRLVLGNILLIERLASYVTIVRIKRLIIVVPFISLPWQFFYNSSVWGLIRSLIFNHKFSLGRPLFLIHKISITWKIHLRTIFLNIFIGILFLHDVFMQALFIFSIFIYNFLLRFLQLNSIRNILVFGDLLKIFIKIFLNRYLWRCSSIPILSLLSRHISQLLIVEICCLHAALIIWTFFPLNIWPILLQTWSLHWIWILNLGRRNVWINRHALDFCILLLSRWLVFNTVVFVVLWGVSLFFWRLGRFDIFLLNSRHIFLSK